MDMINGYIRKSELVIEEFEKMVNNLGMRIEELPWYPPSSDILNHKTLMTSCS